MFKIVMLILILKWLRFVAVAELTLYFEEYSYYDKKCVIVYLSSNTMFYSSLYTCGVGVNMWLHTCVVDCYDYASSSVVDFCRPGYIIMQLLSIVELLSIFGF